ncbi:hypothetical protein KA005_42075, partial [bacterium]|nr:hypothetical protein [bacterium]
MSKIGISSEDSPKGRSRNIIIIPAVIVILLLVANLAGGMIIAKRMDAYIKQRVESLPIGIQYDAISVSPIFGKAVFSDVLLDLGDGEAMRFSTVKVSSTFEILRAIMKDEEITELESVKVTARGCLLDVKERPRMAKAVEIKMGLDGRLNFKDPSTVKDHAQRITFSIKDLSVNAPELALAMNIGGNHANKLTTLDKLA